MTLSQQLIIHQALPQIAEQLQCLDVWIGQGQQELKMSLDYILEQQQCTKIQIQQLVQLFSSGSLTL